MGSSFGKRNTIVSYLVYQHLGTSLLSLFRSRRGDDKDLIMSVLDRVRALFVVRSSGVRRRLRVGKLMDLGIAGCRVGVGRLGVAEGGGCGIGRFLGGRGVIY